MSELQTWLSDLSWKDPSLVLALGSGAVVLILFAILRRTPRRAPVVSTNNNGSANIMPYDGSGWLPPTPRSDERRRSTRRGGLPSSILLVEPKNRKRSMEGFVLDRSNGGLRVALEKPYPIGLNLEVRPINAPEETPWIPVIVRNCREVGDYFEVGCQFDQELPWHLLLMFG